MLITTEDMYRAFLDGIEKSNTAIIQPNKFNRIINDWGQDEWLKVNGLAIELNQKQIDDLEKLRVATDGDYKFNNVVLYPIAPNLNSSFSFTIPRYEFTLRNRIDDGTISTQTYPEYIRLLNVEFKILYGNNNECNYSGVSGWLPSQIMRSDQRSIYMDSSFRKPKDNRLYYEIINGNIRLITSSIEGSVGYAMRLEYVRQPVSIFFNANSPADTGNTATGSVVCELAPQQRKEIVEIAVRTYLERVKDPRYQSFLNEEIIKAKSN